MKMTSVDGLKVPLGIRNKIGYWMFVVLRHRQNLAFLVLVTSLQYYSPEKVFATSYEHLSGRKLMMHKSKLTPEEIMQRKLDEIQKVAKPSAEPTEGTASESRMVVKSELHCIQIDLKEIGIDISKYSQFASQDKSSPAHDLLTEQMGRHSRQKKSYRKLLQIQEKLSWLANCKNDDSREREVEKATKQAALFELKLKTLIESQRAILDKLLEQKCKEDVSRLGSVDEVRSFLHVWENRLAQFPDSAGTALYVELARRKLSDLVQD